MTKPYKGPPTTMTPEAISAITMKPIRKPMTKPYKGPPTAMTPEAIAAITPTPKVNAKKIESNSKKIEKLMEMMKGK